jgi:Phage portal protein, SPP1 Gp6-like
MSVTVPGGIFSPIVGYPTFPLDALDDEDIAACNYLLMRLVEQRPVYDLSWAYYDGMQKMQNLGISIPPQLAQLRTVVGWPQVGVDAIVHRLRIEGFRYPGKTDVDDDLMGIWQQNNLDGEAPLVHLEALVSGRAYLVVGTPADGENNGQPIITAESPRNMAVMWDARARQVTNALQMWFDVDYSSDTYGYEICTYYAPGKTVYMAWKPGGTGDQRRWEVSDVDAHNVGFVPVVRVGNRQRLSNRSGASEITAAWMNTVDSAVRTLLGMEVARELYATPRRYLLGASEEMFQRPDGTTLTKWQAYMDQLWMAERDENGELPTVGEFKASDPSTYTKLMDAYTEIMAMNMGVPVAMLGKATQGNPASADAIRVSYAELTERVGSKQTAFSEPWEQAMRYALLVRDGAVPDGATRIETDWRDAAPRTLAGDSDAITKQITVGAVPATSDVTLKHLGYSAVERARLAQDRAADEGESLLAEISHNLMTKDVTAATRLANDQKGGGDDGESGGTPGDGGAAGAVPPSDSGK